MRRVKTRLGGWEASTAASNPRADQMLRCCPTGNDNCCFVLAVTNITDKPPASQNSTALANCCSTLGYWVIFHLTSPFLTDRLVCSDETVGLFGRNSWSVQTKQHLPNARRGCTRPCFILNVTIRLTSYIPSDRSVGLFGHKHRRRHPFFSRSLQHNTDMRTRQELRAWF